MYAKVKTVSFSFIVFRAGLGTGQKPPFGLSESGFSLYDTKIFPQIFLNYLIKIDLAYVAVISFGATLNFCNQFAF